MDAVIYDPDKDASRDVLARCGLKLGKNVGSSNHMHDVIEVATGKVISTCSDIRTFEWMRKNGYAKPKKGGE